MMCAPYITLLTYLTYLPLHPLPPCLTRHYDLGTFTDLSLATRLAQQLEFHKLTNMACLLQVETTTLKPVGIDVNL